MQEYGWLNWNDFRSMAELVFPRGDPRRVRLVACAIVRRVADRISDARTAAALDAAEDYADFRIRRQDLRTLAAAAGDVVRELEVGLFADKAAVEAAWGPHWHPEVDDSDGVEVRLRYEAGRLPACQLTRCVAQLADPRAFDVSGLCGLSSSVASLIDPQAGERESQSPHCDLLRDIFGNPFHPVALDPTWRTEAVVGLARGMYETRDFTPMPVLADALEDAGCADADVIAHCRGPGPHVRGCWVVDLVLGKS